MKRTIVLLCLSFFVAFIPSCSNGQKQSSGQKPKGPRTAPVIVATATIANVPVSISAVGTVEPLASVAIKPLVGGQILRVHFTEGQEVARGQVLFTIDPRPYRAAFNQASANLARDETQLAQALRDATRNTDLVAKGFVAQSQAEQSSTSAQALEEVVKADRAAVETAQLNLDYCTVRSPIAGRTGSLAVTVGNILKANDIALVNVVGLSPISVSFAVPEQHLAAIKKVLKAGRTKVTASAPNDSAILSTGTLIFIDNSIDRTTGTVRLKAKFANTDRALWPGQFVSVSLSLGNIAGVVVVPSSAVLAGQKGTYLYTVGTGGIADVRQIATGASDQGFTIIEKGLSAGERVVVDGQMRLSPKMKVEIVDPNARQTKPQPTRK